MKLSWVFEVEIDEDEGIEDWHIFEERLIRKMRKIISQVRREHKKVTGVDPITKT